MHQYLRSIGFSKLVREQDIEKLLKGYQKRGIASARRYVDSNDQMWLDIRVPFSDQMGLCIIGFIGSRGIFHRVAYYPYLWSADATSNARPSVFRRVDGELFSAIIDDARVGMTLIYQMDNSFDYLHKYGEGNSISGPAISKMAGFCTKGFVLLPSAKPRVQDSNNPMPTPSGFPIEFRGAQDKGPIDEYDDDLDEDPDDDAIEDGNENGNCEINKATPQSPSNPYGSMGAELEALLNAGKAKAQPYASSNNNADQEARMSLLEAARNGQTDAIEQLALEEMRTIATLSKRLQTEDIYSIVSSVFMPQGVECDIYLVVGEILKIEEIINKTTGELIFDLTLNVNDMIIHVAINEADLEGEPKVGRRFKGRIWLQGRIEFL